MHGYASSSFLSLRLNSSSTRALAICANSSRAGGGLPPLHPGHLDIKALVVHGQDPGHQLALGKLEPGEPADGAHIVAVLGQRALGPG